MPGALVTTFYTYPEPRPTSSTLPSAIKRHLASRTDALPWLFLSERGQPLTRQSVNYLLAAAAARAGLPAVRPHMLRHSCGYYLANRGYDLRLIQDYLGHRDPKHTVHYTRTAASRFEGLLAMSGAAHDLGDLIKWTAGDGWRDRVDAVMAEHFEPAMAAFELTFEEIDDALGGGWAGTLWGCAFEDFLTRRFGPDDENPVEAYLRRRGWKERVATRTYMTALQGSVMSLHEVSDIVPGQSFRARDLIRGGEPVLVTERTATQTLKPWDRIAARIVADGDRRVIAGGVLAFTLEGTDRLLATLRERAAARPHGGRTGKPASALDPATRAPAQGNGAVSLRPRPPPHVTFLSGRNCDFSNGDRHDFAPPPRRRTQRAARNAGCIAL